MRQLIFGILLSLHATYSVADAFEVECEARLPKADIQVLAEKVEPVVDFSKSFLDITKEAKGALGVTQFAMGVTLTRLSREINTDFHAKQSMFGRICIRPKLRITLAYTPMRVYVAKEFGEQSCYAQEVYLHEMRHVRVYEEFLKRYAARLQAVLTRALGQEVYYFEDAETARTTLQDVVDKQIALLLDKSIHDINRAQRAVDTERESARLVSACPLEKAKFRILRAAFNHEMNWELEK